MNLYRVSYTYDGKSAKTWVYARDTKEVREQMWNNFLFPYRLIIQRIRKA